MNLRLDYACMVSTVGIDGARDTWRKMEKPFFTAMIDIAECLECSV